VNAAHTLAVRCLIDVGVGAECKRAMEVWGLITNLAVG
jgi:hypothetical protein